MEKVLITGSAGFIGGNIRKMMQDQGYFVVGVDLKLDKKSDFSIHANTADESLYQLLTDYRFEYIFHFGTPSSIKLYHENPIKSYEETVISQIRMEKFVAEKNPTRFIFPSSSTVYAGLGESEIQDERCYPRPKTLYASAKMAVEGIQQQSLYRSWNALRIFAGYGDGEEKKGEIASPICQFLMSMMKGEQPVIYGDGKQSRDFVYIKDIIRIIKRLMDSNYYGVINVSSGESADFNRLAQEINLLFPEDERRPPRYIEKPSKYPEKLYSDCALQVAITGKPEYGIKRGIKEFKEYLENGRKM